MHTRFRAVGRGVERIQERGVLRAADRMTSGILELTLDVYSKSWRGDSPAVVGTPAAFEHLSPGRSSAAVKLVFIAPGSLELSGKNTDYARCIKTSCSQAGSAGVV
jgi:hypothetical protein